MNARDRKKWNRVWRNYEAWFDTLDVAPRWKTQARHIYDEVSWTFSKRPISPFDDFYVTYKKWWMAEKKRLKGK